MILSTVGNKITCRCEVTGKETERIAELDPLGNSLISETEKALCDDEIKNFKVWMGDKIEKECWCKPENLEAFIAEKKI